MTQKRDQYETRRLTREEIESLVREVLRRVQELGAPRPATAPAAPATKTDPTEVALTGRVITLACLERKLAGVQVLRVPGGAVVTPAVVDELRSRKIQLVRGEPGAAGRPGPLFLWNDAALPLAWRQAVTQKFPDSRWLEQHDLQRAVATVARHVTSGLRHQAVVVSPVPHVVVCAANRHTGVRAATANCLDGLRQVQTTLAPNVLVIDARHRSSETAMEMASTFAAGTPRDSRYRWLA